MLTALLGVSGSSLLVGTQPGCDVADDWLSGKLPPHGELLSPDWATGHRLRDGITPLPNDTPVERHVKCLIVGGGAAGLSAAWHLNRSGVDDLLVIELEDQPGGTSRSGETQGFRHPWGAHYLPVPSINNEPLVEFLTWAGVLTEGETGQLQVDESVLCRDPEERVFAGGAWAFGLFPRQVANDRDSGQLARFRAAMIAWAHRRDGDGQRFFEIPSRKSSRSAEAIALDQISMKDWLDREGYDSQPLLWLVDYSCRDDYGLPMEHTSAWAGLFYFASRLADGKTESQPVMTWPQGNGFLIEKLSEPIHDRILTGHAVTRIGKQPSSDPQSPWLIDVLSPKSEKSHRMSAERVILATPQFLSQRIVDASVLQNAGRPTVNKSLMNYGSWLVANLHLSERPTSESNRPAGDPMAASQMAWDNVIVDSRSLGYVNATHQLGQDFGPTVLTWYTALPGDAPEQVRQQILRMTWAEAAETVLSDLDSAHPGIRDLVTRMDVMRWGHAMVQPRVGSIFQDERAHLARPIDGLHFAGTDLSGIALFEEAFDHGRRAASEVVSERRAVQS